MCEMQLAELREYVARRGINEQDEEVAHSGNSISTSRTTAFRPIWQFAMHTVRLPKAETTWRALLQDGDLMAESHDLSLLSGAGPKCRGDQGQRALKNGVIVETMMISRTE